MLMMFDDAEVRVAGEEDVITGERITLTTTSFHSWTTSYSWSFDVTREGLIYLFTMHLPVKL